MDIEKQLLQLYYNFIKEKSTFGDKVLIVPKTPQSFSSFPTIIFKESNNSDLTRGKSLNRQEYIDQLLYVVEIYSKDITIGNTKYLSSNVIRELKNLTHIFFNDIGFTRISSSPTEYIDITVDRHVCTFIGELNNWNGKITI